MADSESEQGQRFIKCPNCSRLNARDEKQDDQRCVECDYPLWLEPSDELGDDDSGEQTGHRSIQCVTCNESDEYESADDRCTTCGEILNRVRELADDGSPKVDGEPGPFLKEHWLKITGSIVLALIGFLIWVAFFSPFHLWPKDGGSVLASSGVTSDLSLAIVNGRPVIVYRSATSTESSNLIMLRCDNADCRTFPWPWADKTEESVVVPNGDPGHDLRILITSGGLSIAYRDDRDGVKSLLLARCPLAGACGEDVSSTMVVDGPIDPDKGGLAEDSGHGLSIARASINPLIVYSDSGSRDLRAAWLCGTECGSEITSEFEITVSGNDSSKPDRTIVRRPLRDIGTQAGRIIRGLENRPPPVGDGKERRDLSTAVRAPSVGSQRPYIAYNDLEKDQSLKIARCSGNFCQGLEHANPSSDLPETVKGGRVITNNGYQPSIVIDRDTDLPIVIYGFDPPPNPKANPDEIVPIGIHYWACWDQAKNTSPCSGELFKITPENDDDRSFAFVADTATIYGTQYLIIAYRNPGDGVRSHACLVSEISTCGSMPNDVGVVDEEDEESGAGYGLKMKFDGETAHFLYAVGKKKSPATLEVNFKELKYYRKSLKDLVKRN